MPLKGQSRGKETTPSRHSPQRHFTVAIPPTSTKAGEEVQLKLALRHHAPTTRANDLLDVLDGNSRETLNETGASKNRKDGAEDVTVPIHSARWWRGRLREATRVTDQPPKARTFMRTQGISTGGER